MSERPSCDGVPPSIAQRIHIGGSFKEGEIPSSSTWPQCPSPTSRLVGARVQLRAGVRVPSVMAAPTRALSVYTFRGRVRQRRAPAHFRIGYFRFDKLGAVVAGSRSFLKSKPYCHCIPLEATRSCCLPPPPAVCLSSPTCWSAMLRMRPCGRAAAGNGEWRTRCAAKPLDGERAHVICSNAAHATQI